MNRKLGYFCMVLGTVLIFAALSLLLYNRNEDKQAGESANAIVPELYEAISNYRPEDTPVPTESGQTIIESEERMTMPEVRIDGYEYIGILSFPTLEIDLPVMSDWDYNRLRIAPCRQYGTVQQDNLVIAGHNYNNHFGRLTELKIGDPVVFTDMSGSVTLYEVVERETLESTAIQEMLQSGWPLTLYTCTYGGQNRIAIRCDYTKAP